MTARRSGTGSGYVHIEYVGAETGPTDMKDGACELVLARLHESSPLNTHSSVPWLTKLADLSSACDALELARHTFANTLNMKA